MEISISHKYSLFQADKKQMAGQSPKQNPSEQK